MNKNLRKAGKEKKDEFYTQLSDIEKELKHYKKHFKNKVVYCNCDDPKVSNFFHYFSYNFEYLKLKKLITTCYKSQHMEFFSQNDSERAIYLNFEGFKNGNNIPDPEEIKIKYLKGNGDFRSKESIELLKQSDIVVTNPPFSLFREYIAQLIKYDKKFIIIGNGNALVYKEIFPLIKDNKIWLGVSKRGFQFADSENNLTTINAVWYTNIPHKKRYEDLILYKKYTPEDYPHYDNYDAINVNKTKDIPMDYNGLMGVPITFMDKYNPEQFEIIDGLNRSSILNPTAETKGKFLTQINGKIFYARIVIRKRR